MKIGLVLRSLQPKMFRAKNTKFRIRQQHDLILCFTSETFKLNFSFNIGCIVNFLVSNEADGLRDHLLFILVCEKNSWNRGKSKSKLTTQKVRFGGDQHQLPTHTKLFVTNIKWVLTTFYDIFWKKSLMQIVEDTTHIIYVNFHAFLLDF